MAANKLDLTFTALGDPTRRAILAQLANGEANVADIAKPFAKKMSGPAITKHLKVLERAGLIKRSRQSQWRPCRINPAALKEASDWINDYRQFWEASFDRLEEYLATIVPQVKQIERDNKNAKVKKIK